MNEPIKDDQLKVNLVDIDLREELPKKSADKNEKCKKDTE